MLKLEGQLIEKNRWNYQTYSQDIWNDEYNSCKGQHQSPISIRKSQLDYDPNLKPIILKNYDIEFDWVVSNQNLTGNTNMFICMFLLSEFI